MHESEGFLQSLFDASFDGMYCVDRNRRVLRWNRAAERITGYTEQQMLNTVCAQSALCHIDDRGQRLCMRGCPLAEAISTGRATQQQLYLLHRQGHRLPVMVRTAPVRDAQGNIIGAVEVFCERSRAGSGAVAPLQDGSLEEALLSTASRAMLESTIRTKLDQLVRDGHGFGVLAIEPDRHRWARDLYGEHAATELLRMVARTLFSNLRSADALGLWGDQTFLLLVGHPGTQLCAQAKRLLMLVERSGLGLGTEVLRTTVSVGAATAQPEDSPESLAQRAMELLARSKAKGGGCLSMDDEPLSTQ